jgi:MoxR-like ATPase
MPGILPDHLVSLEILAIHHPELFFQRPRVGQGFTEIPASSLVPERMIEGHRDHWLAHGGEQPQLLPRVLVLTDWSKGAWSYGMIKKARALFPALAKLGFSLYTAQDNPEAISAETLATSDFYEDPLQFPPLPTHTLIEKLAAKGIAIDTVFWLDYFNLRGLLIGDQRLDVMDVYRYKNKRYPGLSSVFMTQVLDDLGIKGTQRAAENLKTSELSLFSAEIISEGFPEGTVAVVPTHATILIGKKDATDDFDLRSLKLTEALADPGAVLEDLKLWLRSDRAAPELGQWTQYLSPLGPSLPTLLELSLDIHLYLAFLAACPSPKLEQLETMELLCQFAEPGRTFELAPLLGEARALQKLQILALTCEIRTQNQAPWLQLVHLTVGVGIVGGELRPVSNDTLLSILSKTPNVEYFEIKGKTRFTALDLSTLAPLTQLKTLDFGGHPQTVEGEVTLAAFLSRMPNLTTLRLQYGFLQGDMETLRADTFGPLMHLEMLNVVQSDLSSNALLALLLRMPNLTRLMLRQASIETPTASILQPLPQLRLLDLSGARIAGNTLAIFLSNMPNLEELQLGGRAQIFNLKAFEQSTFPTLTKLTTLVFTEFTQDNLTTAVLEVFLSRTPNLTLLRLPKYTTHAPDNSFDYLIARYPHLKSVLEAARQANARLQQRSASGVIGSHSMTRSRIMDAATDAASSPTAERIMDADTDAGSSPQQFRVQQHFAALDPGQAHPPPNDYRLQVFNHVDLSGTDIQLTHTGDLALAPPPEPFTVCTGVIDAPGLTTHYRLRETQTQFHGSYAGVITQAWTTLPSLHPSETISHLQAQGLTPEQFHAQFEVQYTQRDNLYLIRTRSSTPIHCQFNFLVQIPRNTPIHSALPSAVQDRIAYYRSFTPGALQHPGTTPPQQIEAIRKERHGACRHRAAACLDEFPTQSRMVINGCHAFVEFHLPSVHPDKPSTWIPVNLGSYPADLIVDQHLRPPAARASLTAEASETSAPAIQPDNLFRIVQTTTEGDFDTRFKTWEPTTPPVEHPLAYAQTLAQPPAPGIRGPNLLIQTTSATQTQHMALLMQRYAQSTRRPFFCIQTPHALACQRSWIEPTRAADGTITGTIRPGPGGPLYDFLQACRAHPDRAPILLIDFTAFKTADIVRSNALLDEDRRVDQIPLPHNMVIIGLQNIDDPSAYHGADFRSRFTRITPCPLTPSAFETLAFPTPTLQDSPSGGRGGTASHTLTLDLHASPHWQSLLFGRWKIQGATLTFKPGSLTTQFIPGHTRHLHLLNPPPDDPEFLRFWQEALLRGTLPLTGETQPLPLEGVTVSYGEDLTPRLSQAHRLEYHNPSTPLPQRTQIVNPTRLGFLIDQFTIDDDGGFHATPGLLEQHAIEHPRAPLSLYVTRTLSLSQWYLLLNTAEQYAVPLDIRLAPGAILPPALAAAISTRLHAEVEVLDDAEEAPHAAAVGGAADSRTGDAPPSINLPQPLPAAPPDLLQLPARAVVITEDTDATLARLRPQYPNALVIDVTEYTAADLLQTTRGALDETCSPPQLRFTQHTACVLEALRHGKPVILTGVCTPELADAFMPYLIPREPTDLPGPLLVVTEQPVLFQAVPAYYQDTTPKPPQPTIHTQSIAAYRRGHGLLPDAPEPDIFLGLRTLPPEAFTPPEATADAFDAERLAAVQRVLAYHPTVFLAGATGVGKTTFIEAVLATQPQYALFQTEAALAAWAARDTTDGTTALLFIDEANAANRHWTLFEGLFQNPPFILIDGQVHRLSPRHKVIFAGNPQSYGGERTPARFFDRHGQTVLFRPMPLDYIQQRILNPIFQGAPTPSPALFLRVYTFVCSQSTDTILITPRQLQMMALLFRTQYHPDIDAEALACHIAHHVARPLLPPTAHEAFDAAFPKTPIEIPPLLPQPPPAASEDTPATDTFCWSTTHLPVRRQLEALLAVRRFKRGEGDGPTATNPAQQYGGLGGITVEGEPGLGKSHAVIALLREYHTPYRVIPPSLGIAEKERLLLEAFDQGLVVVMDEINSSPMMERLLNDLLMGKHPTQTDEHGRKRGPLTPGFLVLGTQNPITMRGRHATSLAIQHRTLQVTLAPYTPEELPQILQTKFPRLPQQDIQNMVAAYLRQRAYAEQHHKEPMPTFRDLVKIAKERAEALARQLTPPPVTHPTHPVVVTPIAVPTPPVPAPAPPVPSPLPTPRAPPIPIPVSPPPVTHPTHPVVVTPIAVPTPPVPAPAPPLPSPLPTPRPLIPEPAPIPSSHTTRPHHPGLMAAAILLTLLLVASAITALVFTAGLAAIPLTLACLAVAVAGVSSGAGLYYTARHFFSRGALSHPPTQPPARKHSSASDTHQPSPDDSFRSGQRPVRYSSQPTLPVASQPPPNRDHQTQATRPPR